VSERETITETYIFTILSIWGYMFETPESMLYAINKICLSIPNSKVAKFKINFINFFFVFFRADVKVKEYRTGHVN